jgi:hypothetical protein
MLPSIILNLVTFSELCLYGYFGFHQFGRRVLNLVCGFLDEHLLLVHHVGQVVEFSCVACNKFLGGYGVERVGFVGVFDFFGEEAQFDDFLFLDGEWPLFLVTLIPVRVGSS